MNSPRRRRASASGQAMRRRPPGTVDLARGVERAAGVSPKTVSNQIQRRSDTMRDRDPPQDRGGNRPRWLSPRHSMARSLRLASNPRSGMIIIDPAPTTSRTRSQPDPRRLRQPAQNRTLRLCPRALGRGLRELAVVSGASARRHRHPVSGPEPATPRPSSRRCAGRQAVRRVPGGPWTFRATILRHRQADREAGGLVGTRCWVGARRLAMLAPDRLAGDRRAQSKARDDTRGSRAGRCSREPLRRADLQTPGALEQGYRMHWQPTPTSPAQRRWASRDEVQRRAAGDARRPSGRITGFQRLRVLDTPEPVRPVPLPRLRMAAPRRRGALKRLPRRALSKARSLFRSSCPRGGSTCGEGGNGGNG